MQLDCTMADNVEIKVIKHNDGFRIWVNVDGLCAFRAYRVQSLDLDIDGPTKGLLDMEGPENTARMPYRNSNQGPPTNT